MHGLMASANLSQRFEKSHRTLKSQGKGVIGLTFQPSVGTIILLLLLLLQIDFAFY